MRANTTVHLADNEAGQSELGKKLGDSVGQTLAGMIIRGEFAEGERLYPDQLAARFGVSITPVREALMQLANEGFIEAIQRRGFHIRVPTADQIRNVWQVRQSLELCAGELVIRRIGSGALGGAELERLEDLQDHNATAVDHAKKLELNSNFHSTIIELAENPILTSMYRSLQHKVVGGLVQRGLDSWRARVATESDEHKAIIKALQSKDYVAYDAAVRNHLARSLQDALSDLSARS